MAYGISPSLPLVVTATDGPYGLTKSVPEALSQDFKNLVLTNPGERVMDPEFGVGIRKFLFEAQDNFVYEEIQARLESQTRRYLPAIRIEQIVFNQSENELIAANVIDSGILYVKIVFSIVPTGVTATLILPLVSEAA
jgi:phage baseplate assembly protein W